MYLYDTYDDPDDPPVFDDDVGYDSILQEPEKINPRPNSPFNMNTKSLIPPKGVRNPAGTVSKERRDPDYFIRNSPNKIGMGTT